MSLLTSACATTGASLVLVTHDPAVASRLPHTIHVRDGRVSLSERGGVPSSTPASQQTVPSAPAAGTASEGGQR